MNEREGIWIGVLYMISLFSLIIDAGWDSEVCMRLHLAFGMGIFVVG